MSWIVHIFCSFAGPAFSFLLTFWSSRILSFYLTEQCIFISPDVGSILLIDTVWILKISLFFESSNMEFSVPTLSYLYFLFIKNEWKILFSILGINSWLLGNMVQFFTANGCKKLWWWKQFLRINPKHSGRTTVFKSYFFQRVSNYLLCIAMLVQLYNL